jgi:hypothetical protein
MGKQVSPAFFEKKAAKKLLLIGLRRCQSPWPRLTKVFWFFFSKKNCFLSPLGTFA